MQFLLLVGRFLKIFSSETAWPNEPILPISSVQKFNVVLHKRSRKPKRKSIMGNPEKLATLGTQDTAQDKQHTKLKYEQHGSHQKPGMNSTVTVSYKTPSL